MIVVQVKKLDKRIIREDHFKVRELSQRVFGGNGKGPPRPAPNARQEPPVYFLNEGTQAIPAFGMIELTGRREDGGRRTLTGRLPTTTFVSRYAVNSDREVAPNTFGKCYTSGTVLVLIGTGTPANDQVWGPKPGEPGIYKGFPGAIQVHGVHDSTRSLALGFLQPITQLLGKTTGSMSANAGSSLWQIYAGTLGSETATTFTAPASWTRVAIGSPKWMKSNLFCSGWHTEPLEC